jgi:hypothetical protein
MPNLQSQDFCFFRVKSRFEAIRDLVPRALERFHRYVLGIQFWPFLGLPEGNLRPHGSEIPVSTWLRMSTIPLEDRPSKGSSGGRDTNRPGRWRPVALQTGISHELA